MQALTTSGQTVLDVDDDPTLRHASTSQGRRYRTVDSTLTHQPGAMSSERGDLVVARWPRLGDRSWITRAPATLADIRAFAAQGGRLALVLEPTPVEVFTITWTGVLLSAAATAGLTVLQDVVCLHVDPSMDGVTRGAGSGVVASHRVVLILSAPAGRHVRD